MRPQDRGDYTGPALFLANPYVAFATLSHRFDRTPILPAGIHASAVIAESAEIPASACIGALAVIGEGVVVGEGCVIEAGVVVHDRVRIGTNCRLRSRVVIYHDCGHGGWRRRLRLCQRARRLAQNRPNRPCRDW